GAKQFDGTDKHEPRQADTEGHDVARAAGHQRTGAEIHQPHYGEIGGKRNHGNRKAKRIHGRFNQTGEVKLRETGRLYFRSRAARSSASSCSRALMCCSRALWALTQVAKASTTPSIRIQPQQSTRARV